MFQSIILGLFLTVATVGIHAAGTSFWIEHLKRRAAVFASSSHGWLLHLRLLGSTAVVLLLLHIAEVTFWAVAYLWLNLDEIHTIADATYFSTVTFTTLGYGDVVIAGPWRMLAAIESMVGLLIFGWSTAMLFTVVQRIWESKVRDSQ
jgi:hypothetical protein